MHTVERVRDRERSKHAYDDTNEKRKKHAETTHVQTSNVYREVILLLARAIIHVARKTWCNCKRITREGS